jgi:hypothetical protein
MESLKSWYSRKLEILQNKKDLKEVQNLISFYLQKKTENSEYSVKDWNEEYKKYRKKSKM